MPEPCPLLPQELGKLMKIGQDYLDFWTSKSKQNKQNRALDLFINHNIREF